MSVTTIVCGTDFSPAAVEATRVATALTNKLGGSLRLIHVSDDGEEASEGVELRRGAADEELIAAALGADLLIVGSIGHRHGTHWFIGSTAESVAQSSPIPVLVIRRGDQLCEAVDGKRRACVIVATDLAADFHPVVLWVSEWRKTVPSDVHLVYVSNPPAEYARLQIEGPIDRDVPHPVMQKALQRELQQLAARFGENGIDASFTMTLGATSREIVRVAEEQHADLIVIGAHQRNKFTRAWRESVAHGVLHSATTNVAVVPLSRGAASLA